jgi:hypothetical protein
MRQTARPPHPHSLASPRLHELFGATGKPRDPVDGQFTDQRIYVDNAPVDSLLD